MGQWFLQAAQGLGGWIVNIIVAAKTVALALWVTMRYWIITYDPKRGAHTEHYEYPELPAQVADRYRGFHRYDLTSCTACGRCAKDCPAQCIDIGKQRAVGRKGLQVTNYTIDYTKCMFCALCVEVCPVSCLFMGSSYNLSCYSRDGCVVDFSRLPLEIAWGRDTLNPTVVANAKAIAHPVHEGPSSNQAISANV